MTIGWQEVFLLMVLALVVFGPNRLPDLARQVGRFVGEIRRISREFENEVREVTDPIHRELAAAAEPIEREVREAEAAARELYDVDDDFSVFQTKPEPPRPPAAP
jgi:sec-independent protein translocase protein TatB